MKTPKQTTPNQKSTNSLTTPISDKKSMKIKNAASPTTPQNVFVKSPQVKTPQSNIKKNGSTPGKNKKKSFEQNREFTPGKNNKRKSFEQIHSPSKKQKQTETGSLEEKTQVEVVFLKRHLRKNCKGAFLKVLENCADISAPLSLFVNIEMNENMGSKLRKLVSFSQSHKLLITGSDVDPLKKVLKVYGIEANIDDIKQFYNVESAIEKQLSNSRKIFTLSFKNEEEANNAKSKPIEMEGKRIFLNNNLVEKILDEDFINKTVERMESQNLKRDLQAASRIEKMKAKSLSKNVDEEDEEDDDEAGDEEEEEDEEGGDEEGDDDDDDDE